jgi:hypothetical protein
MHATLTRQWLDFSMNYAEPELTEGRGPATVLHPQCSREALGAAFGTLRGARWHLILMAALRSWSAKQALECFGPLFEAALKLDRLPMLAEAVDSWDLTAEDLEGLEADTVIEIVSLLIHEQRKEGLARRICQHEVGTGGNSRNLKRLATVLPVLMECFGPERVLAEVKASGVDMDSVAVTPEWANAVADMPRGLLPFCRVAHAEAWRSTDTHQARLAVFLFEWQVLGRLRFDTLSAYFGLRSKHKLTWLRAIRRSTVPLQRLRKERDRFRDYADLVREPLDFVFLATLGVRLDEAAFSSCLLDNRLCLQPPELAYCFSQYRIPLAGMRLINERLRCVGTRPLQVAFPQTIQELFEMIIADAAGLAPSEDRGSVAVVMTTRDPDSALIQAAVDSVAAQDYPNLELILVDDGSSRSVSVRFDARPGRAMRVLRNDESLGPYVSRNRAIAASKSRFIAFQDDDDVSHPQRLSLQVSRLEAGGAKIVNTQHIRFDERGRLQMDLDTSFLSDGPVTMVMNRQTFLQLGEFLPVRSRGDVEYRARCMARFGPTGYFTVPAPLYYALGKGDTLSSRYESSDFYRLRMQRRLFLSWQEAPCSP